MTTQRYTSEDTSLAQVCAIYSTFTKPGKNIFRPGDSVLDYGGGRYDLGKEYMARHGVDVHVYDPYNRTPSHNSAVLRRFKNKRPDFVVCSNVLNVIKEDGVIRDVVKNIRSLCGKDTVAIFSVYEGDRTGIGRPTSKGYQRNQPTRDYERYMSGFSSVDRKGRFIFCRVR